MFSRRTAALWRRAGRSEEEGAAGRRRRWWGISLGGRIWTTPASWSVVQRGAPPVRARVLPPVHASCLACGNSTHTAAAAAEPFECAAWHAGGTGSMVGMLRCAGEGAPLPASPTAAGEGPPSRADPQVHPDENPTFLENL